MKTREKIDDQRAAKKKHLWLLYGGVKSLLRCDEAEIVQELARYIISQYRILQVSTDFIEKKKGTFIPDFIAFLSGVTRFLEVRASNEKENIVWTARYDNERHAIEKLLPLIPETSWAELKFRRRPTFSAISALVRRLIPNWRRIFKLARLLHGKYNFFKVFRVIELISYYTRYLDIFEKSNYRLAVVSNHSNPHGMAFNLAAKKCGIPTVLMTHGMPIRPVAKLSYDLAIVHCEFARQIYLEAGCQLDKVFVHGQKQNYVPMSPLPLPKVLKVGIFLCKDVNENCLQTLVNKLLTHSNILQIIIRPHPKNLWLGLDAWIESLNNPRLQKSSNAEVSRDLETLDFVFAGNSSVLVEAVTAGNPSIFIPHLDYGNPDLHEFVARQLIYQMNDELDFKPDEILKFYLRPEWSNVLRFFANIDEDEVSVIAKTESALREILG